MSAQTFRLKAGESITVEVRENPSTGYVWSVEEAPEGSLLADDFQPSLPPGSARPLVGGGGVRTFTFRVPTAGIYQVKLVNRRPWMKDKEGDDPKEHTIRLVAE